MNPYEKLANAIILSAVQDYREVLLTLSVYPYSLSAQQKRRYLLQFFHSDWFCLLTNLNPESLIEHLDKEVAA